MSTGERPHAEVLSAAILTGGASRRMGRDKALIEIGGRTLLEWVLKAVAQVADDVTVIGDRPAYHRFGLPVVGDAYPSAGALGGIATALTSARHDWVLVVACDMPLLSVELLTAMAGESHDADVLAPVTCVRRGDSGVTSRVEPMHAIYARRCLGPIAAAIRSGRLKVADAFNELDVRELPEPWLRRFDPELRSFMNVNTPGDLPIVRALLNETTRTKERPD